MPVEPIQAGDDMLRSEFHRLINSTFNEEELPQQWKEHIIVLIYEQCYKPSSNTSTPQYVFMAWCLVKHRDNFTFT